MNILKSSISLASFIFLTACASVPAELKYKQPSLPLGSSSIQGMRIDNKGFLSVDEYLRVVTVDGKFVKGYEGAPWADKIAIYPGDRVVEVLYDYPDFLIGVTTVMFNAKEYTEYQFKFEYPYVPKHQELENFNRQFNTSYETDTLWARVWAENLSTGVIQSYTLMPLQTITTIPIVL